MFKKCKTIAISVANKIFSLVNLKVVRIDSGFWDFDETFKALYKKIKPHTLVRVDRCYMLYQFAQRAALLPDGDVAQVGVYKGGTALLLAQCFVKTKKKFYLFDTFEGLPDASINDGASGIKNSSVKEFTDTSLATIQEKFQGNTQVVFKQGFFPDTAQGLESQRFAFVYLDPDLYKSTKDGLEFFYPRMVPGGVIMFDDYGTKTWPGVEKAVREFCIAEKIQPITTTWWQGLIVKS